MQALRPPVSRQAAPSPVTLPGLAAWHGAVWRCWVVLAVLGLAAGVAWRMTGGAPPVGPALDATSLALMLSALWLAPAWEQLLKGAQRYERWGPRSVPLLPKLLLHAAAAALAIACAPLGLLLAYHANAAVAQADTAEGIAFSVPLSAAVLATLLLAGISLVLLSTGMLTALRGLARPAPGLLLWLALVLTLHASLLQVHWWASQPVTLGGFLLWLTELLTRTVSDPSHSFYMTELLRQVLGLPLVMFVAALAVLLGSAFTPRWPAAVLQPWLVPATAVLAVALCAAIQTIAWAHDMARRSPGDWHSALATGLLTLLLGHWLLAWDRRRSADWRSLLDELLWAWWALGACVVCTLPYISAGQAGQLDVLRGLACMLIMASPALLLVRRLGALRAGTGRPGAVLLLLALILVVLPPAAAQPPLLTAAAQALALALQQPEQAPFAYWVLAAMAVLGCLLWPWPRHGPSRARSSAKL
jgi:hypothetical protein